VGSPFLPARVPPGDPQRRAVPGACCCTA
jgi:hypothetical protein